MNPRAEKMFVHTTAVPGTKIKAGVGVIVCDVHGRILLEKRSDCGLWGMLGGAIDPGESVESTAIREVQEESGFEIKVGGLVGVYSEVATHMLVYPSNGDVRQLIDIVLEARIIGGTLRISHESEDLAFFSVDHLPPEDEIVPPARAPLADFFAGRRGVLK